MKLIDGCYRVLAIAESTELVQIPELGHFSASRPEVTFPRDCDLSVVDSEWKVLR